MIEAAVAPLREQLQHERGRAERAEEQVFTLRSELAGARIAEQLAMAEAADLRRRLDTTTEQLGEALQQVRLLTDQRASAPAAVPARRWWIWGQRG
jgi:uncharacterized membrane protein